jgi:hypothetical protein
MTLTPRLGRLAPVVTSAESRWSSATENPIQMSVTSRRRSAGECQRRCAVRSGHPRNPDREHGVVRECGAVAVGGAGEGVTAGLVEVAGVLDRDGGTREGLINASAAAVGSAPTSPFSRPAQRSLSFGSACSPIHLSEMLHRRRKLLRHLHHCSNCYRRERKSPGGHNTR